MANYGAGRGFHGAGHGGVVGPGGGVPLGAAGRGAKPPHAGTGTSFFMGFQGTAGQAFPQHQGQFGGHNFHQQQFFYQQQQGQFYGGFNDGGFQSNQQGSGSGVVALHFDPGYGGGRDVPQQRGRDRSRGRNSVGRGAFHQQGGRGRPQGPNPNAGVHHPGQAPGLVLPGVNGKPTPIAQVSQVLEV